MSKLGLTGDIAIDHTHLSGINRMVFLRGGLENLGMNGMLKTMVLW
jgi:hypothetical protein